MVEKLDVIIFGATGFTGKHTVFEANSVLKNLKWGIAGRSREKLEAVLKEMGKKAKTNLMNIPIFIADVNDEASLLEMARQCRVVVNCCGPYRLFGEPVVNACIEAGAHHVDVSGEPQYMEKMELKYNQKAQERNVYIISACGFDSIPTDMGIIFAENNFNGVVNSIETYLKTGNENDSSDGALLNFGTWESAVYVVSHDNELQGIHSQLYTTKLPKFQPILRSRLFPFRSEIVNGVCLPFPGPDRSVVLRSQRFLYETEKKRPVQMHAYAVLDSWMSAISLAFVAVVFGIMAKFSCGRRLLLKYPKFFSGGKVSREGPNEGNTESLHFSMFIRALGWPKSAQPSNQYTEPPNKTLTVSVSGRNPAYGATCVSLLTAATTILKENEKMPGTGGVLPPGAAFLKTSFISELEKHEHGMKFKILDN